MKNPIAIISNDWHIDESNLEEISGLISQQIKLAKSLNVKVLVLLGDIFKERKAQKEIVLNAFKKILDLIFENGLKIIAIPGNHDKTNYESYESFLDPFSSHQAFQLIRESEVLNLSGVNCCFIPFFTENIWVQEFEKITTSYDILFSHIAVNGSINNNKTKVESSITPARFKKIKQVFLGHYHDTHEPASNIVHLPSIQQNNFGENTLKGFTVLYDDLTFEIKQSSFKQYETIQINGLELTKSKEQQIIESFTSQSLFLRLIVNGDSNIIKSLNFEDLKKVGIKVCPMLTDIIIDKNGETRNVDYSEQETLINAFNNFCIEKGIDFETGVSYIKSLG